MKKLLVFTAISIILFSCSNIEEESSAKGKTEPTADYAEIINDTILLDFDIMQVQMIFESDTMLRWNIIDDDLVGFQTEKSQTVHLNKHSFITTWVETETDGDHITQFVDLENKAVASVVRKSNGSIITVKGTISKTE